MGPHANGDVVAFNHQQSEAASRGAYVVGQSRIELEGSAAKLAGAPEEMETFLGKAIEI